MDIRIYKKKMFVCQLLGILVVFCILSITVQSQVEGKDIRKPIVIATTDGEIDDRCSMIRFLMYANEWDIRGLIHSSSKYHWKGDEKHKRKN